MHWAVPTSWPPHPRFVLFTAGADRLQGMSPGPTGALIDTHTGRRQPCPAELEPSFWHSDCFHLLSTIGDALLMCFGSC